MFTVVVALFALSRLRPPTDARFRAFQVLTVLPTAALPLATGGDDMPVVALMLLGLVALQRRRPVLAGLALGAASSLKFTAWPLVVLAPVVVADRHRRRALGRYVRACGGPGAGGVPVALTIRRRSSTTSSGSRWAWPACPHRRPAPRLLPCVTATLIIRIRASRIRRSANPPMRHSSSGCGEKINASGASVGGLDLLCGGMPPKGSDFPVSTSLAKEETK